MRYRLIIAIALALVPTQALAQSYSDFKQEMDIYVEFCRKDDAPERINELKITSEERKLLRMLCIMYNSGVIDTTDLILGD